MTAGQVIRQEDIENRLFTVQLFNGQRWKIEGSKAFRFTLYYTDGQPEEIIFAESSLEKIYGNIKLLFDEDQHMIGSRMNQKCRLLAFGNVTYCKF